MSWDLKEALGYYSSQGAPADQTVLVSLLKEIQQESGGRIPSQVFSAVAQAYNMKETLLRAVIRRIPSLQLDDIHCLELCCGEGCGKRGQLIEYVKKLEKQPPQKVSVKYTGCMRQCGKGPNIRWDGVLYHQADERLLRKLVENS